MHKNIKLLAWFNFFTDFSFFAPIAIIYYSKVAGSYALGASIFSLTMLSSSILEIPTGVFSDYIGRRKTMVIGAVAAAIAIVFYALGLSYWFLVIGAIFEGLSRAFFSGNNNALLYDTLRETGNEKEFHDYLGKTHSLFQLALAISGALGSIIASFSFALSIWLTLIPKILGIISGILVIEPKSFKKSSANIYDHLKESVRKFKKNRKLRLLTIASVINYSLSESGYQFKAAFVNTVWPLWAIGFASVLSNIGATISYYFSGKLIKKYGELKMILAGSIYGKVTNIISLVYPTVASPAIMSTSSVFFGVTQVSKETLVQKEFDNKDRATMGSLNSFASSLAFAVVSFFLGYIADRIGPAQALLTLTIAGIPVIFIYSKLFKEDKRKT